MHIIKLNGEFVVNKNFLTKTIITQKQLPTSETDETTMVILSEEDIFNIEKTHIYLKGIRITKVFLPKKFKNSSDEKNIINFLFCNFKNGNVSISYY